MKCYNQVTYLKQEDPSPKYTFKSQDKIGTGQFSRVYNATRAEDQKTFALKVYIKINDEKTREEIIKNIFFMKICRNSDFVLQIVD